MKLDRCAGIAPLPLRSISRQRRIAMTEIVLRFEHLVGRAALKLWPDFPRDLQERLFEDAAGGDELLRHHLALYLHNSHPRTSRSPSERRALDFQDTGCAGRNIVQQLWHL